MNWALALCLMLLAGGLLALRVALHDSSPELRERHEFEADVAAAAGGRKR